MDASLYWASNPGPYDIFNRVAAELLHTPVPQGPIDLRCRINRKQRKVVKAVMNSYTTTSSPLEDDPADFLYEYTSYQTKKEEAITWRNETAGDHFLWRQLEMGDRDYYYDGIKEPTANQSEKSTHVFAKGNKNTHIVATVLHRITPNFRGHISAGVQFTGLLTNRIIRIPTVSPVFDYAALEYDDEQLSALLKVDNSSSKLLLNVVKNFSPRWALASEISVSTRDLQMNSEMGVRYKLPGKTPEQPKLEAVVKFSPTGDVHSTIAVKPSQNTAVAAGAATNLYTRKTRADIAGLLKFYVAGAPCVMRTGYATSNGVSMFLGTRVLGRFAVGIGASYGGTDHPAVMVVPRAPIPGHPAEAFDLSRLPALQKVRFGLFLDL